MGSLPKIIDNNRKKLLDILKDISKEHDRLSIATGYWDLKGTQEIFESIRNYKSVRLLIGREPLIPRHKEYRPEPDYPDKDFFCDLENMQPTPELKSLVISMKKMIKEGNLEVRVYRKSFFHAKSYIFGDYSSDNAVGIIGSSNFTLNGLTHNAELNALEDEHRIVTFKPMSEKQEVGHLYWFDSFWNDPETEEWNGKFTELLEHSPVGDILFSPFETYIKTLYEIYHEELIDEEYDESIKGIHDLYDFQKKNVNALIRRLKKYKVAMLADSVGLGKTYTAIEVIKQYLTTEEGKKRVEVICPKSLVNQWESELLTQGVANFRPLTLQNPEMIESKRKLDDIAAVSLFVIDESHNLRNSGGKRFEQILEWVRNNPKAHVLLLTATPINNQLSDIVNQILLGARGESGILNVTAKDKKSKQTASINFHQAIENLKKKMNQDLKRTGEIDYEHIKHTMSPILRAFVVRRTRQGIEREYGGLKDGEKILKFPKVNPEVKSYGFSKEVSASVYVQKCDDIDLKKIYQITPDGLVESTKDLKHPLRQLENVDPKYIEAEEVYQKSAIHFVYQIILLLGFIPYRWSIYQTKYYGKTREQIKEMRLSGDESRSLFMQLGIYGILRTVFLKRLESSVSAIRASLDVYKRKLDVFEKGLNKGYIMSLKDLARIEDQLKISDNDENNDEAIVDEEMILDEVNDKKYALADMKADILKEKLLIDLLSKQLSLLEKDDSKIKSFAELLDKLNKTKPSGKKVLVFSFFADTITYLEKAVGNYTNCVNKDNAAFVSSKNRTDADTAANRFAPVAKKHKLEKNETELDYLFSTDILSEGQNLQDCGILINYDLHWNPVRMIQRNGRINRIGSPFERVHIYNIKPEAKLEEYLKLVARLETKINLIRNTIGTDSPVLDEKENPIEFTDSWSDIYSDSLQKRLAAMEKAEKEADFLLSEDEYISDLKIFNNDPEIDEKYKQFIYNISRGKWAVMPKDKFQGDPRPDILCLNRLCANDGRSIGHEFVSIKKDFSLVPQLQALEWLKTDKTNNERQPDKISADKAGIKEKINSQIYDYLEDHETGAPVGQQTELLRFMFELHFSEEEIGQVEKSFGTSNVFVKKSISALTRKIMKNKKDNKECFSIIKELVETAKNAYNEDDGGLKCDKVEQILYYAVKND